MRKTSLLRLFVIAALGYCSGASFARECYVDAYNGLDSNDGLSWAFPYQTLTNAFRNATNSSTIYLRGGQIHITTNVIAWTNNSVSLLGGYEGTNEAGPGNFDETAWPTEICYTNTPINRVFFMTGVSDAVVGRVTISGGRLTNSTTLHLGAGMYIQNSTNVFIFSTKFTNNVVNLYGAGLALTNSAATISGCVFRANIATNLLSRYGGGLFAYKSSLQVIETEIEGNEGGGVGLFLCSSNLFSGCTISSNIARQYGAGMFLSSTAITMTNCQVRAKMLDYSAGPTYGSGIYQTNCEVFVWNTLFDNNRSYSIAPEGQSVYLAKGTNWFYNCTFVRHNVEGFRVQQPAGCQVRIINSILWDNGDSLVNVDAASLFYSDIREGDNEGFDGCISKDPEFADYFGGDFHLKSQQGRWLSGVWMEDNTNSPCIDAGDPGSGYANETDPNGGRVNMGFYGNTPEASRTLHPPEIVLLPDYYEHNVMFTQKAKTKTFTIQNINSFGRKITFTNTTDYGWFSCDPASGEIEPESSVTITNLFDTSVLGVGSYSGRVTVVATDSSGNSASNSPAFLSVLLDVSPEPTLRLSQTNLVRTTTQGTDAGPQAFEVWNDANPDYLVFGMQFYVTSSAPWLTCSPTGGVSFGNHVTVTNIFHTAAVLGAGSHTATLTVHASSFDFPDYVVTNSPQQIAVTVTVNALPGLMRYPAVLTNFTTIGFNAPTRDILVWNNSPEPRIPLNFTVATNAEWMSADPLSGSSMGEPVPISVRFTTKHMLSGIYTGSVIFTASGDATNTPLDAKVLMIVNSLPECTLDTYSLVNYGAQGHNAESRTIQLWNSSDEPKGLLSYVITDDAPWFSVTPSNGVNYGDPSTLTVNFNTASLPQGTHHGIITVKSEDASTGAGDMTRQVAVALLVSGSATLTSSVTRVEHTVLQNAPGSQKQFSIWNAAPAPSGPMSYVISSDSSWLSLSPASGTTTGGVAVIGLNFNTAGLLPGAYTGKVTVVAWDPLTGDAAFRSPLTLQVALTVNSRHPANHEKPTISGLPYIGQTLTANKGFWTPTNAMDFSYQWQTADSLYGLNTVDIPGATSTTYVVQSGDIGKYMRIRVTCVDRTFAPPLSSYAYSDFSYAARIKATWCDFDNDGKADLWFYYPPTGTWRFLYSMHNLPAAVDYGWAETAPLPGDYDGDGLMDIAVYYQAEGLWYIWTAAGAMYSKACGWWAATPVPGDYDGDGATDLAVYHGAEGVWYVLTYTGWFFAKPWGWSEAYPYPAEFNGDGITDLAVYHQSAGDWYVMTLTGEVLAWKFNFGWNAVMPAPADYDGDGKADYAVYYQAGNIWYFVYSMSGAFSWMTFGTAAGNGIPMPADYDGDGICDPATVHANGNKLIWCIKESSNPDPYTHRGNSYDLSTGLWR